VGSAFGPQTPFNPASRLVVPGDVTRAEHDQEVADLAVVQARSTLNAAKHDLDEYRVHLDLLHASERAKFDRAVEAKRLLVERAVTLYMDGGNSASLALLGSPQPSDIDTGMTMLDSVLDTVTSLANQAQSAEEDLRGPLRGEVDREVRLEQSLVAARGDLVDAQLVSRAAHWQLVTYQDGSHIWIPGFVFPVAGTTRFVDSFGDSRLAGTKEQHWHEGCDVMAATGTPLVAVEDGVLKDYGHGDPLGGQSLLLQGASGYSYYYAHLSRFVPGMRQGDLVKAGTVIGYVGSTGDAVAPHLHFEIHEPDGLVLDSYGLLKAAWSARQQQLRLPGVDPGDATLVATVAPTSTSPDGSSTSTSTSTTAPGATSVPPGATGQTGPTAADPGRPGGFPRYPDGTPVQVEATLPPPPPN
jgi:murein DD-endopeptidase MepM/ murein hydrolase activator NlpD